MDKRYNEFIEYQSLKNERIEYANQMRVYQIQNQEKRRVLHDLNNRLFLLNDFLERNPSEELSTILENIIPKITDETQLYSGNILLDYILSHKIEYAREQSINVDTDFSIPHKINIENVDLAVLTGNIIDNAIEGCLTKVTGRYINISARYFSGNVLLEVTNNFDGVIHIEGSKIKSRKENPHDHGYGLINVQQIVDKYEGSSNIDYTNSIFKISLILTEKMEGEQHSDDRNNCM